MENKEWDRWAAEKVMEWIPCRVEGHKGKWWTTPENNKWYARQEDPRYDAPLWQPSTDLNHLWMVVERMKDYRIDLFSSEEKGWFVRLYHKEKGGHYLSNKNLNIAILMAAKKALEGWDEEQT